MYPDDDENGFNRFDQGNPMGTGEVPPVEPRYAEDIKKENNYYSEYDDSYNYTDKKAKKAKVKKEKAPRGQRGIAGVLIVACIASAIGGSLLTGYVVMPAISGGYALAQKSTQQQPTVVASAVTDQSTQLGAVAPVIADKTNPVPEIATKLASSVVGVKTYNKQYVPGQTASTQDVGYGTGFIISSDGLIVTNNHVIEDGGYIKVILNDGKQYDATVQGKDYDSDVAVLKINATGLTAVSVGNSDKLEVGQLVVAIGNPLDEELAGTVTVGYLSSLNRTIQSGDRTYHVLQTDAAINPGNSGGPLIDSNGQVIGMTALKSMFAGMDEYGDTIATEGIGFAIPINYVMEISKQLISKGSIEKPGIGLSYYMITDEDVKNWNVPKGALVGSVTVGGPAQKAGVQENDIITAVDGVTIDKITDLAGTIKAKGLNASITLTIWRNSQTMDIKIVTEDINKLQKSSIATPSAESQENSNPFGNK
jgi:serine protease Do